MNDKAAISEHRERAKLRITATGNQWLLDHPETVLPLLAAFFATFPENAAFATLEPNPIGAFIDLHYKHLDKCQPIITLPPEAREALVAKFVSYFVQSLNQPEIKDSLASEGITYDIKYTAVQQPKPE